MATTFGTAISESIVDHEAHRALDLEEVPKQDHTGADDVMVRRCRVASAR